jgi:photosystem II stability/assembly factor-like uncharacterized protein
MKIVLILCSLLSASMVTAQSNFTPWTQANAPYQGWRAIASSADGTKLVAVALSNGIYTSTNSGVNWTQTSAPSLEWSSVASSADGVNLVAVLSYGGIYTSTNSGTIWTLCTNAPNEYWNSVASSSDGTILAAAPLEDISGNPLPIYISTNSGNTWMATTSTNNFWTGICLSADGRKLVALSNTGKIYTSTNSGAGWTSNSSPSAYWSSVASSADGTKLIAVANPGAVYTSTNSGITWMPHYFFIFGFGFACSSADGVKLAVVAGYNDSSRIFTSIDSGQTWIQQSSSPNANWGGIALSADGQNVVAVIYYGGIWTSQSTPAPQMNITPANGNLCFSWIVPSTNFVVQQSSDLQNWWSMTNAPVLNLTNLHDEMILSPSNASGFFRLATP